jgi:hypothetical protein
VVCVRPQAGGREQTVNRRDVQLAEAPLPRAGQQTAAPPRARATWQPVYSDSDADSDGEEGLWTDALPVPAPQAPPVMPPANVQAPIPAAPPVPVPPVANPVPPPAPRPASSTPVTAPAVPQAPDVQPIP